MKYFLKYGRQKNLRTYFSDYAMYKRKFRREYTKGDLRITKNYRDITLTAIAAEVYNVLLHNCIQPEVEKILRKNQNSFQKNHSTNSQILTVHQLIKGVLAPYMFIFCR